jgi:hypothetical protein
MVLIEAEQKMRTLNSMKEDLNVINCLQAHLQLFFDVEDHGVAEQFVCV